MKIGNIIPIHSERLRTLRKSKGMTQEEVSRKIGYDIKSYRTWELGEKRPSTGALMKLGSLFGVSIDYILGLTDYTHVGNQEICAITGLSQESVDILRALMKHAGGELYPQVLSLFITSSYFMPFITQIRHYASRVEQVKERWNASDTVSTAANSYTLRAEKFGVTDVLSDLLDEIIPLPQKGGEH